VRVCACIKAAIDGLSSYKAATHHCKKTHFSCHHGARAVAMVIIFFISCTCGLHHHNDEKVAGQDRLIDGN